MLCCSFSQLFLLREILLLLQCWTQPSNEMLKLRLNVISFTTEYILYKQIAFLSLLARMNKIFLKMQLSQKIYLGVLHLALIYVINTNKCYTCVGKETTQKIDSVIHFVLLFVSLGKKKRHEHTDYFALNSVNCIYKQF